MRMDIEVNFAIRSPRCKVVNYTENCGMLYFDPREEVSKLEYGFAMKKQPLCIYCNISPEQFATRCDVNQLKCYLTLQCSLYLWDDAKQQAAVQNDGIASIAAMTVIDKYDDDKAGVQRVFLMNSILSIFMLILECSIISIIVQLEYTIHAKKLALKKIYGYSMWQKNKPILLLNLFASLIGIGTDLTVCLLFHVLEWKFILLVGALILLLEWIVIVRCIAKFERANLSKILKGGSL